METSAIQIGTIMLYSDYCNFQKWEVTELFEGGFLAKDNYEEKDFWFDQLQNGWEIYKQPIN